MLAPGLSERLFVGRVERLIDAVSRGEVAADRRSGTSTASRDYVALEQALDQLLVIADSGVTGEVYHVACGVGTSMRELLSSNAGGLDHSAGACGRCAGGRRPVGYRRASDLRPISRARAG